MSNGIRFSCAGCGCKKPAIVWLSGRPLCLEHYIGDLNELNDLGLTPGLSREGGPAPRSTGPARVRELVDPTDQQAMPKRLTSTSHSSPTGHA
jgi:hypothetical protein